ncbi:hypothetical protein EVAR_79202_1 [Eumeta japonica]|uniref:Uncharacterized protein n=1 Tax=Eumeta variegata TaxID=151549 RepID=A0A4C1UT58_EUMVA|nr:hypothetical protein EVAR_79202_1 [Eumeta japonica]
MSGASGLVYAETPSEWVNLPYLESHGTNSMWLDSSAEEAQRRPADHSADGVKVSRRQTRVATHNGVLIPTFTCGSESWVWQKEKETTINAVEMRSLCSMCGLSRKDKCRNSDVRERCGLKEDVVARVERGALRWLGHPERMNEVSMKYEQTPQDSIRLRSSRISLFTDIHHTFHGSSLISGAPNLALFYSSFRPQLRPRGRRMNCYISYIDRRRRVRHDIDPGPALGVFASKPQYHANGNAVCDRL